MELICEEKEKTDGKTRLGQTESPSTFAVIRIAFLMWLCTVSVDVTLAMRSKYNFPNEDLWSCEANQLHL